jgi:CheY-like chemotaxis protein
MDNENTTKAKLQKGLERPGDSDWIRESEKIARFFHKVGIELSKHAASAASVEYSATHAQIVLYNAEGMFRTITLQPRWGPLVERWVNERSFTIEGVTIGLFSCGEQVLHARVERQTGACSQVRFSDLEWYSKDALLAQSELSGATCETLQKLLVLSTGKMLLVTPHDAGTQFFRALLAALWDGVIAPNAPDSALEGTQATDGERLLYCIRGEDPCVAATHLKLVNRSQVFQGVIAGCVLPRVCSTCGKESPVSKEMFQALPEQLHHYASGSYHVGRGCSACGHTGSKGVVPLAVALELTQPSRELLEQGATPKQIIKACPTIKSLFEEGVKKAFQGKVTLGELRRVVPQLPPHYEGVLDAIPAKQSTEAPLHDVSQKSHREPRSLDNSPVSILVVEDDLDQREILTLCLANESYTVVPVESGRLGLEAIQKKQFDLVITDLLMPEMDGAEFVARLRADKKFGDLPILVLTALTDDEKEYSLLSIGADDYCEKRVQRKILLKRVENLIKRSHAINQVNAQPLS